jgi:hypothetical protein
MPWKANQLSLILTKNFKNNDNNHSKNFNNNNILNSNTNNLFSSESVLNPNSSAYS